MNLDLIKCALDQHKYGNLIKNETLDSIERHCIHCDKTITVVYRSEMFKYKSNKEEIIKDINLDSLYHAKQKLNLLLKDLGY